MTAAATETAKPGTEPGTEIDRTLAALADPSRRGVVDLLRRRPRRAGDLARALDLSAPAMSRHLRGLRKAGLVEEGDSDAPDDARVRVYRLRQQPFASLRQWTEDVEAFWGEQLSAFAAHVEKRSAERPAAAKAVRKPTRGGRK